MSIGQRPRVAVLVPWYSLRETASTFLAGSVAHLLLLVPTLVTLQIYDRVLSSRRIETLWMLITAAALALASWWLAETAREHWHAARASEREHELASGLMPLMLDAPAHLFGTLAQQVWRDLAVWRSYLGSPAPIAFADLPWSLIYLLVITAFHPLLGGVAVIGMIALVGLACLTEWRLRDATAMAEKAQGICQSRVGEVAAFVEVLHAHGQQAQVAGALKALRSEASLLRLKVESSSHSLKTFGKLIRQALQFAMLGTGAWLVLQGQATAGVMIAGSILLGKALMPLEMLIGSWKLWLEARKAFERLQQLLGAQDRNRLDPARLQPETVLPACKGQLRATHLGLRSATHRVPVLHDLNFDLPSGAMLAVLGESGSGKTTLARILAGVLPPTQGQVAMDGAALSQYGAQARGQATGYVPQDVLLHGGSVAHNIARQWHATKPLTDEQSQAVIQAARRAGAHELIAAMPHGYDTLLGADLAAHALSGGQRQRIALSRALYATPSSGMDVPRLIVLDEPNSQLDADGDAALERCLRGLRQLGSTVVVVTHRPHLIALATHVLLLRNGMVERFGPREDVRQWIAHRNQQALKVSAQRTADAA
jgi:PrtD family type I secretion system ABC transporter